MQLSVSHALSLSLSVPTCKKGAWTLQWLQQRTLGVGCPQANYSYFVKLATEMAPNQRGRPLAHKDGPEAGWLLLNE